LADPNARRRADGARIDNRHSFSAAFENSILAEQNLLDHLRIADAEKNDVGMFRNFSRGRACHRARFACKLRSLRSCVRPDRDAVSGFQKIAGHRVAHESKSEESEFCHRSLLSLRGGKSLPTDGSSRTQELRGALHNKLSTENNFASGHGFSRAAPGLHVPGFSPGDTLLLTAHKQKSLVNARLGTAIGFWKETEEIQRLKNSGVLKERSLFAVHRACDSSCTLSLKQTVCQKTRHRDRGQFGVGRSIESITSSSTVVFVAFSFSPNSRAA